jgi:hypothetical protein
MLPLPFFLLTVNFGGDFDDRMMIHHFTEQELVDVIVPGDSS